MLIQDQQNIALLDDITIPDVGDVIGVDSENLELLKSEIEIAPMIYRKDGKICELNSEFKVLYSDIISDSQFKDGIMSFVDQHSDLEEKMDDYFKPRNDEIAEAEVDNFIYDYREQNKKR